MPPKRKYHDDYIRFGFTSTEVNRETTCVLCATVLSNDALKPAKLERHLKTVHSKFSDRPPEFFKGKLENLKIMKLGPSGSKYEMSQKAVAASFEISKLIAKSKKSHTIGETLVKPCLLKAVVEMLGEEAKKKFQDISLSNNTVKDRIVKMSQDIEEQLITKMKKSSFFALQCDETTDVAQCSQLLVFVRFLDEDNNIKEEMLLSRELETTSRGVDVFKIISDYFEKHNISWEKLAGFCTDGAPAMLGSRSGLATLIKQKDSLTVTTHCVIHRQALASKTLPEDLSNAMKLSIKIVNIVKSSALNTRVFKKLCADLDSEHEMLLFHTEVRWLSKGNMLQLLYELREEVKVFLCEKNMIDLLKQFCDPQFEIRLSYLVEIFSHLNKLNLQLQGSGNSKLEGVANIFVIEDKLRAFIEKINLWIDKIKTKTYSAFPTLNFFIGDRSNVETSKIEISIVRHLQTLREEFTRYFPEFNAAESETIRKVVRNPFIVNDRDLPDEVQEEVIELQNDSSCRDVFNSGISLEEFWCKKALSYSQLRERALRYLVMFSTTFLCEQGFSALLLIKNKHRNRLDAGDDMRVALSSNINPRISLLVTQMQAQKSH